jgi:alcohol dehydrogenase
MAYFGFGREFQNQYDAYPYGGLQRIPDRARSQPREASGQRDVRAGAPLRLPRHVLLWLAKLDFRPGQTVLVDGGRETLGVGTVLLALAMGASHIFATGS